MDLPDDGFPTKPMSGSRGIVSFKHPLRYSSRIMLGFEEFRMPCVVGLHYGSHILITTSIHFGVLVSILKLQQNCVENGRCNFRLCIYMPKGLGQARLSELFSSTECSCMTPKCHILPYALYATQCKPNHPPIL